MARVKRPTRVQPSALLGRLLCRLGVHRFPDYALQHEYWGFWHRCERDCGTEMRVDWFSAGITLRRAP